MRKTLSWTETSTGGGSIGEILEEYCSIPADEVAAELTSMAGKFRMKQGMTDGTPLYFKDCTDPKLISSPAFDVANFIVMTTSALVTASNKEEEEETEVKETRFQTDASNFIRTCLHHGQSLLSTHEIEGVDVRFGAIVEANSLLWIFSYLSGNGTLAFRRNISDSALNCGEVWESPWANRAGSSGPFR